MTENTTGRLPNGRFPPGIRPAAGSWQNVGKRKKRKSKPNAKLSAAQALERAIIAAGGKEAVLQMLVEKRPELLLPYMLEKPQTKERGKSGSVKTIVVQAVPNGMFMATDAESERIRKLQGIPDLEASTDAMLEALHYGTMPAEIETSLIETAAFGRLKATSAAIWRAYWQLGIAILPTAEARAKLQDGARMQQAVIVESPWHDDDAAPTRAVERPTSTAPDSKPSDNAGVAVLGFGGKRNAKVEDLPWPPLAFMD